MSFPESDVERGTADCAICGATQPSAHVSIRNKAGEVVGRVCSHHSLWDGVKHGIYAWLEKVEE